MSSISFDVAGINVITVVFFNLMAKYFFIYGTKSCVRHVYNLPVETAKSVFYFCISKSVMKLFELINIISQYFRYLDLVSPTY